MVIDTTELADAILAYRKAVAATEAAEVRERRVRDRPAFALEAMADLVFAEHWEQATGRSLLAALEGVPERLAALEVVVAHRKVRRAMSALEGEDGTLDLEDALAALDASRKGAGDGDR